ncbi:hypothetical protein PIB30_071730, partial [Stylosanthes scabra]|nr:hypothetical protein [Stylosanthes scabra]
RVNRADRRVAIQLRASIDMPEVGSLHYAYTWALGQAGMLRSCLSSSKRELKREHSGFPRICVGLLRS